jgi:tetratricopeptide (TPR) repeat protein
MLRPIALLIALLALPGLASADSMMSAPAASARPAPVIDGLGPLHHPVSTKVPEAQRFFDQGLRLCWAFNHDEAIRAFRRAAELDPKLAMAWWGVALANGPNINLPMDNDHEKAALDAVKESQSRLAGATDAERAYIEAIALRYGSPAGEQRAARDSAYTRAMDALRRRYPADLDATVLWAESMMDLRPWNYWAPDASPYPGTQEVIDALEAVIAKDPKHIGANHLHIHILESVHPERAEKSADRLVGLAPSAGHLEHMPSHIYARLGRFERSGDINAHAASIDRDYIAKEHVEGVYPLMYYNHNVHFAAYSYAAIGRYQAALPFAKEVSANASAVVKAVPMASVFTPTELLVDIRCNRWSDVLAAPDPGDSIPFTRVVRAFGRGLARVSQGNAADARAEQKAFETAAAAMPPDVPLGLNPPSVVLHIPAGLLAGRIAELEGRNEDAATAYRAAVAAEDSIAYDEPPDWYVHARETLGGYHLRRKAWTEAEAVFRADLARNPGNPRSLFGLAEALKGAGRTREANQTMAEFNKQWAKSDTKLTVADL